MHLDEVGPLGATGSRDAPRTAGGAGGGASRGRPGGARWSAGRRRPAASAPCIPAHHTEDASCSKIAGAGPARHDDRPELPGPCGEGGVQDGAPDPAPG